MEKDEDDGNGHSVNSNAIIVKDEENNKANTRKKQHNKANKHNDNQLILDQHKFKEFFRKMAVLQFNTQLEDQEQQRKFIKESIVPLNNKHVATFTSLLRDSLTEEIKNLKFKSQLEEFEHSVHAYSRMNQIYRECGVNSPILIATYHEFQALWKKKAEVVPPKQVKQTLFRLWRDVPYQILKTFLQSFQLQRHYCSLDPEQLIKALSNDLFQCKIQQAVEYYHLYINNRKIVGKERQLLDIFQQEQLIPRLVKKDQLFAQYVLNFIRKNKDIGQKIYKVVDIKEEEKLMNLVGDDYRDHQRVVERASRRHYREIVRKNKEWYIVEDKLSFSPKFLRWYAQDLLGQKQYSQSQSQGEHDNGEPALSEEQSIKISKSILARLDKNLKEEQVKNPLYELDAFCPAELILQLHLNNTNFIKQDFLPLNEQSIFFIDEVNELFEQAEAEILSSQVIGFDSQFLPTENKFIPGGVSIIQLSTLKHCYIFDYQYLRSKPKFIDFFAKLMHNSEIIKVGHTFSSDLQYLNKNFPKQLNPQGLVDISKLFKDQFPQQLYTSLAYMTHKFMGKQLCKYEQRSNWARRPLKKTQIYYAALDAVVCLAIYRKMVKNKEIEKIVKIASTKSNTAKEEEKTAHQFDMVKFEEYAKNPTFLVDNMLKKLCSTMRNCGIDAQFISIRDHELIESQGRKQRRIIVTRDSKLVQRKGKNSAIYFLKEKNDTQLMFQQLLEAFSIDLSKYQTLSRCVKCNGSQIIVITSEEAMKEVNFVYQTKIQTFWRCAKCRQIYWQGGQFTKAKSKFDALKK